MDALADTIVYLFAYLNVAGEPVDGVPCDDIRDDDDCKALESVAAILDAATPAEVGALWTAAQRAITRENAAPSPRQDYLACYDDLLGLLVEREILSDHRQS